MRGSSSARLTREHNDTNVLALGAFIVGEKLAYAIVDTWLGTEFSKKKRHQRRIDGITEIENKYLNDITCYLNQRFKAVLGH